MSDAPHKYRVESGSTEDWFDDLASAQAAVAIRLGIAAGEVDALRRRVTSDPIVVRRDDARWRSAAVWAVRSANGFARLFEMVRVDEAAYDH